MVHSSALMNDPTFQVVTPIRTDIALECFSVVVVKECRMDRLAFDSQCIVFKGTIMSYDRVLPSVEILVFAQPCPEVAKKPDHGMRLQRFCSVHSAWVVAFRVVEGISTKRKF